MGDFEANPSGEADLGGGAASTLSVVGLPPLFKAPIFERKPQFFAAADVEFSENILQMSLYCFVGNAKSLSNLVIPATHTGQRGDFPFPLGQAIPAGSQLVVLQVLIPAGSGKIHPDFFLAAALLLRRFLNGCQQLLICLEGA